MHFSHAVAALVLSFIAGACTQTASVPDQPEPPAAAQPDAKTLPDAKDGMQAIADAAAARFAMPGKAHYDRACATCHEGAIKKAPHREMIGLMTPQAILRAITDGVMQTEASVLTDKERLEVSEFLAGKTMAEARDVELPECAGPIPQSPRPVAFTNWGLQPQNTRFIPMDTGGLDQTNISGLQPKWSLAFPGANRARSQPAIAGDVLFVGSHSGAVFALNRNDGCVHWRFQASGEVRTGIVTSPDAQALYFGDVLGNVYALNAGSGGLLWKDRADDHPNATITGTPSLHDGRLFVPVSSLEVSLAVDPSYECCTFRGSVVAYDAGSGERVWKTYTITEPATVQSQNRAGTNMRGPSGAVIWNSPAIDTARNQLYVGTGENMSSPATETSDAIFAIDLSDGTVNWVFQATANDVWNTACDTVTDHSCPPEAGPDFDFGSAPLLTRASDGRDLVVAGQKSGVVHALNPDTGAVAWQRRVGRGGIQGGVHFGIAAAHGKVFVPISDMADGRTYDHPDRPGVHALNAATGETLWYAEWPDRCDGRSFCHPGVSQAITVISNMVVAGGMDGIARAFSESDGRLLWELDTTQPFETVSGDTTRGGSFGGAAAPVAFDGTLILSSGYGIYNHMPGNLLVTFSLAE